MKAYSNTFFDYGERNRNGVSTSRANTLEEIKARCIKDWARQRNLGYSNHNEFVFQNITSRLFDEQGTLLTESHMVMFIEEMKVEDYENEILKEMEW